MSGLVELLTYAEPVCCVLALAIMIYRGQLARFKPVALFLVTRVTAFALVMPLIHSMKARQNPAAAYSAYFYIYWISYAIEAVLGFFIILGIYNLAMAPLPGLKKLGMLMFRWAAGIAVAIAITMALGPHVSSSVFVMRAVIQLQETQSILTLCMLLFVCLAIRPMGLSHGSKIFGVSLGLGLLATTDLASSAWIPHLTKLYSTYAIINGIAIAAALLLWTGYFAVPEPKRRMIILPTTSPFLRWNQISLALGDEPGFVAVGEVSPEMFAPAEVEVMRRATLKMRIAN